MKNFNELFNAIANTDKKYVEDTVKKFAAEIVAEDGDIKLLNIAASIKNIVKISGKDCVESKDYYDIYLEDVSTILENFVINKLNIKKHNSGFNFNL